MANPQKLVVAGLIVDDGGQHVLISQRPANKAFGLAWEFPGGKIEAGESPAQALVRELREELDVEVLVGGCWDVLFYRHPTFDLLMLVYQCRIVSGQPTAKEVAAWRWAQPHELAAAGIIAADAPLVARLVNDGIPAWRNCT